MLEWLKGILGDSYTEEVDKQVSAELGGRFTSKADYNARNEELKSVQAQLAEAGKTIEGFKALDVDGIKKAADEWKAKAEQAEKDAAAQVAAVKFDALLEGAITKAGGRSTKAIKALLDLDALKTSQNQEADLQAALDGLAKESGYLFDAANKNEGQGEGATLQVDTGAEHGIGGSAGSADGVEAAFAALNPDLKL